MTDAPVDALAPVRAALQRQYHAALAMLRSAVEAFPDTLWDDPTAANAGWQVAYHALYFTHLYLQPEEASFRPWAEHQAEVQHPDGIAGPPDPASGMPLLPHPYTRGQVIAYADWLDTEVDDLVDALDLVSPESGFWWYRIGKLEHQLVNLRHLQHHTAQLADRVRTATHTGVEWVSSRPARV